MTALGSTERREDGRTARIAALAVVVGVTGGLVAALLISLIRLITHLAFEGRASLAPADPSQHHLGAVVILIPIIGAALLTVMARWGSEAIRGHGIPEVMDRILHADSRIPAKLTILKPLSAARSRPWTATPTSG